MSKLLVKPALRLRMPATSANLGPAFDAAGLALSLTLTVEARSAEAFSITAVGRDAPLCAKLEKNLMLETYLDVLGSNGLVETPLQLSLRNEIPLGMGCGSSAAALLAGVALADHFGDLGWSDQQIVAEASRREGHPDNVAACWYGGFTVSAQSAERDGGEVTALNFAGVPSWRLLLALPQASLATKEARALLPETYSRADAVYNVQRSSLLVSAFAQGRLDLLRVATADRLHQPYRMQACPLLPRLLPLAGVPGIAAVTLSGAGPSVLVFVEGELATAREQVQARVPQDTELLELSVGHGVQRTILD